MKKFSVKDILIPAVVLLLICGVVTALLAGTNMLTYTTIQKLTAEAEEEARRKVLPEADSFTVGNEDGQYYIGLAKDGLTRVGYVFITEAKGYGGTIRVMTGIAEGENGGSVTGVEILSHNETPGLGANATKESFIGQFRQEITGKTGFALFGEEMGIDAMTGATITSTAVVKAVNQAVASYQQAVKEVNAK